MHDKVCMLLKHSIVGSVVSGISSGIASGGAAIIRSTCHLINPPFIHTSYETGPVLLATFPLIHTIFITSCLANT